MQTYLYLHKENIDLPHGVYRGKYPLKHFDYGLSRNVGRKGEITSDRRMRRRRYESSLMDLLTLTLLGWLFDTFRKEDGAIVTLDEHETTFAN